MTPVALGGVHHDARPAGSREELELTEQAADVDRAGVDLTAVERWFFRQGVPQYVYNYWPTDSIEVLFYLLLIVVAFDLSIQPWVSFNPWFLLIAPAVLVFLGLLVRMMIIDPARHLISGLTVKGTVRDRSASINAQLSYLSANRVPLLKLLVSVYVAGCLLFQLGRDVYWTDATFDFVVIAVLLWSAARLFRPEARAGDDARSRERRRVYAVVAVAVIGFALEGSILPDSREVMDGVLGTIMPSVVCRSRRRWRP